MLYDARGVQAAGAAITDAYRSRKSQYNKRSTAPRVLLAKLGAARGIVVTINCFIAPLGDRAIKRFRSRRAKSRRVTFARIDWPTYQIGFM